LNSERMDVNKTVIKIYNDRNRMMMMMMMMLLLLIQIGAFFMLNLCLVVIATQFADTKRRETESMAAERRRRRRRRRSSSTLASCSAEDDPPDGCYAEIIKYIAHVARRARRRVVRTLRRPKFVRRIEAAFDRRFRNDPEAGVDGVDRRGAGNRRRRRKKERTEYDEVAGAPESPLSPPAVSSSADMDVGSPLAPRASPEPSDIDPTASPRWPRGSVVTPSGSAGASPPLGSTSSLTPAVVPCCRSAGSTTEDRQDVADLDYYNSLCCSGANADEGRSFIIEARKI